jgi:hypothetical protein
MSRTFTDSNLLVWEVYASGGPFGLPERPKLVFNCLSAPDSRARYVVLGQADEADAEEVVATSGVDRLRALLEESRELD